MNFFDKPLSKIKSFQDVYVRSLRKMGILTIRDLLFHFPFRYEDYSKVVTISQVLLGQPVTLEGKIIQNKTFRTWRRKIYVTEIKLADTSGEIKVVWFNQSYLSQQLAEGKKIRISGKASWESGQLVFSNPLWEFSERLPTNTARIVPIYPESEGVTSRWLRWQIQRILRQNIGFISQDPLPQVILRKLHLPALPKALEWIHFPKTQNHALVAQKRFAFEEMFLLQLKSLQVRSIWQNKRAVEINFKSEVIRDFTSRLPFKLTNAQRKAAFEILRDLEKPRPMNRLLNGDVGSGKTAVAAIACLSVVKAGYQTALMVPTEVLARQHFETLVKMPFPCSLRIALMTSSCQLVNFESHSVVDKGKKQIPESSLTICRKIRKNEVLKKLSDGTIDLIIGTHALIQKDIRFRKLALVIVDEQHRFGVAQRAYLQNESALINDGIKDKIPHFLTMTATPIPRTLALAFFGNLDISILDEMPAGRRKIITRIISPPEREAVYGFIRQQIKLGRQAFIILPLVEESQFLSEVKAAISEYNRLSQSVFPEMRVGLIHGRLKSAEKEKVMKAFASHQLDILVATAVIEVGVDIPNATLMVIEDADRFGLSQLHQFRGRIGRGKFQSYCFLFSSADSASARQRLRVLAENTDGFVIAEKDLELRGPGELLGIQQSGMSGKIMSHIANVKLIQIARSEAFNLLKSDPLLKNHSVLKEALESFDKRIHLE